MGCQFISKHSS